MDFIEQLPPSSDFTDILVIVDRFTKQSVHLHSYNQHCNLTRPHSTICPARLFKAWCTVTHNLGQRFGVHFTLLAFPREGIGHPASLHLGLPPRR